MRTALAAKVLATLVTALVAAWAAPVQAANPYAPALTVNASVVTEYDIAQRMKDLAVQAHRLLGCKGASRSDFRWDDEHGLAGIYLLEVNTQPGMTPLSLVPEQARAIGIDYAELVERIVEEAL